MVLRILLVNIYRETTLKYKRMLSFAFTLYKNSL